ncbi:dephospho-CoA kinase domain-containing protein-like isoform X3 [Colius striatus]|uniref:dephospho-CoA kinase domain-containing protein isoform X3 n=1 Tax=Colius striatus TaxID=57412 RepID=UPI002B1E8C85|nr:dephospho-CoA kinase domain-containing protein isoform X3 [Colius striatus]XP_061875524.1 dephospho-CoA kinase domain-containing protein-like isoform X3 [Colius striatus]
MFLVGLSGGIASGKSTVVAVLRELGCAIIDADAVAREVVQPPSKAHQQIVHAFGTQILLENGEINRQALGDIIFSHPEKRQLLNSITHPKIQKEMLKQILKYFVLGHRYVILDIPLLFETNRLTKFMKYTVLVYCCRWTRSVAGPLTSWTTRAPGRAPAGRRWPCTPSSSAPGPSCGHGWPWARWQPGCSASSSATADLNSPFPFCHGRNLNFQV